MFLEDKVPRRKERWRFDKTWTEHDGLLDSISKGWNELGEGNNADFVTNLLITVMKLLDGEKNPLYEKKRINELQRAWEEGQTNDSRTQEEIVDVTKKLQEVYKDEEE